MRVRQAVTLMASCAALVAAVPTANGVVILDKGAAGVRMNMTKQQVRAILGPPLRTKTERFESSGLLTTHTYRGIIVSYYFHDRVSGIRVTRRTERTRRGIGIGSTEAQVRARVGGLTCETISGQRVCSTLPNSESLPGALFTNFDFKKGVVTSVFIARVLE